MDHHNYLTHDNHARICDHSSFVHRCAPSALLTSDQTQVWLSGFGVPHWVTIDFSGIQERAKFYQGFGVLTT